MTLKKSVAFIKIHIAVIINNKIKLLIQDLSEKIKLGGKINFELGLLINLLNL